VLTICERGMHDRLARELKRGTYDIENDGKLDKTQEGDLRE